MSRRDGARRGWTHRRLGIGRTDASEAALAKTDAMLSLIGARGVTTSATLEADVFSAALFDYACDLDLVAGIAAVDATPVGAELLRLTPAPVRRRVVTWKLLIPATSGALAALVVAITLVVSSGGSSPMPTPSLSATAESRQLLQHAHALLAAAADTVPAQRTRLYTEARADLRHVSQLLPLAPPPARPAIRSQLRSLRNRVPPPPHKGAARRSTAPPQRTQRKSSPVATSTGSPVLQRKEPIVPSAPPARFTGTNPPQQGGPNRLPPPGGQNRGSLRAPLSPR